MNTATLIQLGWSLLAGVLAGGGSWVVTNPKTAFAQLWAMLPSLPKLTTAPAAPSGERDALLASIRTVRHKASEGPHDTREADLDSCDVMDRLILKLFPEAPQ